MTARTTTGSGNHAVAPDESHAVVAGQRAWAHTVRGGGSGRSGRFGKGFLSYFTVVVATVVGVATLGLLGVGGRRPGRANTFSEHAGGSALLYLSYHRKSLVPGGRATGAGDTVRVDAAGRHPGPAQRPYRGGVQTRVPDICPVGYHPSRGYGQKRPGHRGREP